jgi:hypothetical protein
MHRTGCTAKNQVSQNVHQPVTGWCTFLFAGGITFCPGPARPAEDAMAASTFGGDDWSAAEHDDSGHAGEARRDAAK